MNQEEKHQNQVKKGFFLFSNNQITEIVKNDYKILLDVTNERIRPKILFWMNIEEKKQIMNKDQDQPEMEIDENKNYVSHSYSNFWNKLYNHFERDRPNFSL